jgi:polysaccharide biosynthesis/export protein
MPRALLLVVLIAIGAVYGCAAGMQSPEALRAPLDTPYRLASGDRLRMIVFGQEPLSNSFNVDSVGNVSLPLIGAVRAQGLTTAELERSVEARLHAGYLRDPRVAIEVEAYRPFFVLGEVTTAGQYPFINGMTVETAIAVAGGFSPRGDQSHVDITRILNGRQVTAAVPLNFPVRPGDTIKVAERFF